MVAPTRHRSCYSLQVPGQAPPLLPRGHRPDRRGKQARRAHRPANYPIRQDFTTSLIPSCKQCLHRTVSTTMYSKGFLHGVRRTFRRQLVARALRARRRNARFAVGLHDGGSSERGSRAYEPRGPARPPTPQPCGRPGAVRRLDRTVVRIDRRGRLDHGPVRKPHPQPHHAALGHRAVREHQQPRRTHLGRQAPRERPGAQHDQDHHEDLDHDARRRRRRRHHPGQPHPGTTPRPPTPPPQTRSNLGITTGSSTHRAPGSHPCRRVGRNPHHHRRLHRSPLGRTHRTPTHQHPHRRRLLRHRP